jgi:mannose-6-phosphate isomerase-like protein (cupin superfamily)
MELFMPNSHGMLTDFSNQFQTKVPEDIEIAVQIEIQPGLEVWNLTVSPGGGVALAQGTVEEAAFVVLTDQVTLTSLYEGRIAPLTAAGRVSLADPAPLDFRPGPKVAFSYELYKQIIWFCQRFFNRFDPEMILIGEEHSRLVHGGNAVAFFYDAGFRSAWYSLKKGQQLNEPGDTNPFPQAFIIISGTGEAVIGKQRIKVQPNQAYYIPAGTTHTLRTEMDEPLELVWLAWGQGV